MRAAVALAAMVAVLVGTAPDRADAYATTGCKFSSGETPSITYNFFELTSTYQSVFTTSQSNWDAHTNPTTFLTKTTSTDPNIDVFDYPYVWSEWAKASWGCTFGTFHADEVAIELNQRTMADFTTAKRVKVTTHEIGHAYGLAHVSMSCGYPAVMEQGTDKFGCSGTAPWEDDVIGWDALY